MIQPMEGHTVHSYDGELSNLHILILEMGGLVLDQVRQSVHALIEEDLDAAKNVIAREPLVDKLEVQADNEIVSVIAKRCPVAKDLRIITAVSKAVTDLERVGDEAARIAHMALSIYENERTSPNTQLLRDINSMGKLAIAMLKDSLDIFDNFDLQRAQQLAKCDIELDAEFQSCFRRITTYILEDARNVGHAINIVLIVKSLERVGDHARNLAEYIIFLIKGEDVRHQIPENQF